MHPSIPIYKKAPVLRLLAPFISGILLQWFLQFRLPVIVLTGSSFTAALLLFYLLPLSLRFKCTPLQGLLVNAVFLSGGMLVTWNKDVRHNANWYGHFYKDSAYLIVKITEPLAEKSKSFKAAATVENIIAGDTVFSVTGNLLLYFSKDAAAVQLQYGDRLLIHKNLQPIKNSGNPGAFNYAQYAAVHQTFHNVFLKQPDWLLLQQKEVNRFKQFLFTAREQLLAVLRKNIAGQKDELGIAEALLIGYTNDLDKDLVQAYSNTGVVHIIAISGMHLGLIYMLLVWLFARTPLIKKSSLLQAALIVSSLWLFSLLTGGAASVIRSAVMFTFITLGKTVLKKNTAVFSSLAVSAFIMLCYNPCYLWDVGFQLSYLAVTGIVVFQQPIYNWLYIKNKWADKVWQLTAVSLAAQLLTFPVCIYYFHQFPNLFLLTNLVAVPLSTIILFAAIVLVALAWVPFAGLYIGKLTGWLVWAMNKFILWMNNIPFAVWDGIPATLLSTWLLYAAVTGCYAWLMRKNKKALYVALTALLAFTVTHAYYSWQTAQQQKLIVYNVPGQQAIDFVSGTNYMFTGDSVLQQPGMLQNFHLKPARISLQLSRPVTRLDNVYSSPPFYLAGNKRVLIVSSPVAFEPPLQKIPVDVIVISKNPKLRIAQLAQVFNCSQYVADASNSLWKIGKWKEDCDKLHLRFHSIPELGAYVLDL